MKLDERIALERLWEERIEADRREPLPEGVPVALVDQHTAANRDAEMLAERTRPAPDDIDFELSEREVPSQSMAVMLTAAFENTRWFCPHANPRDLQSHPRPLIANLGYRVMYCAPCEDEAKKHVAKHRGCDICETRPTNNMFRKNIVQIGPLLIMGSIGDCCFSRMEQAS